MGEASSTPPAEEGWLVGWMKQSVCACTQLDGDDEAMHRRELKLNVIFAVQRRLLPRPSQCGSIILTVYLAPLLIYRQQFLSVQICHLFGRLKLYVTISRRAVLFIVHTYLLGKTRKSPKLKGIKFLTRGVSNLQIVGRAAPRLAPI